MSKKKLIDSTEEFENEIKKKVEEKYILRLYVTGTTEKSLQAIKNLKRICEEELKGRYTLEVIDLYKHPELAKADQIIAVPTLLKKLPPPLRRIVGTLSDKEKCLLGLNLRHAEQPG